MVQHNKRQRKIYNIKANVYHLDKNGNEYILLCNENANDRDQRSFADKTYCQNSDIKDDREVNLPSVNDKKIDAGINVKSEFGILTLLQSVSFISLFGRCYQTLMEVEEKTAKIRQLLGKYLIFIKTFEKRSSKLLVRPGRHFKQ